MSTKELISFFEQSSEDLHLSSSEKKSLKNIIDEANASSHDLHFLRSKIFDIARQKINGYEDLQILDWLEKANKLLLPANNEKHGQPEVYFSPGNDCLDCILREIRTALKKIDICVFTISDDRIKKAILLAKHNGIQIRLITDDDKSYDRGSDVIELGRAGIPLKMDNSPHHMHHKFAIFDDKKVITGSFNWTRSASSYNQENIVLTSEKEILLSYKKEFDRLWDRLDRLNL